MQLIASEIKKLESVSDVLSGIEELCPKNDLVGRLLSSFAGYCSCLAEDGEYQPGTLAGLARSIQRDLGLEGEDISFSEYLGE